jgi:hypothetical protein
MDRGALRVPTAPVGPPDLDLPPDLAAGAIAWSEDTRGETGSASWGGRLTRKGQKKSGMLVGNTSLTHMLFRSFEYRYFTVVAAP